MSGHWCRVENLEDFIKECSHEEFHQVFTIWLEHLSYRSLPLKQNIDPIDIPRTLSKAFLYEYDGVTNKFYLRIAGEEVLFAHDGRHRKGAELEDNIPKDLVSITRARWSFCVNEPAVMIIRREFEGTIYSERLILPIAQNETRFIFGVTIYQNPDGLDNPYHVDQLSRFAVALPVEKIQLKNTITAA